MPSESTFRLLDHRCHSLWHARPAATNFILCLFASFSLEKLALPGSLSTARDPFNALAARSIDNVDRGLAGHAVFRFRIV